MPSAGFELATPATKRPQNYALDRAVTEVGSVVLHIDYSDFNISSILHTIKADRL
jgi:hypothetical protein